MPKILYFNSRDVGYSSCVSGDGYLVVLNGYQFVAQVESALWKIRCRPLSPWQVKNTSRFVT